MQRPCTTETDNVVSLPQRENRSFHVFVLSLLLNTFYSMAKGNILLGYGRGAVGDVVFSRVKGQQIAKARNRMPANPRTKTQMAQRSRFVSAVKFFANGNQAQFKFAYEDRKATESDYNAFMRHNANEGIYLTPQGSASTSFPKMGKFLVSKGSLSGIKLFKLGTSGADPSQHGVIVLDADLDKPTTIGELSTQLLVDYPTIGGKILTFFKVDCGCEVDEQGKINEEGVRYDSRWYIGQMIVDVNDTTPLEKVGLLIYDASGNRGVCVNAPSLKSTHVWTAGVIVSQRVNGELKVSTCSTMDCCSIGATKFVDYYSRNPWLTEVYRAWEAQDTAVLAGGIVADANAE